MKNFTKISLVLILLVLGATGLNAQSYGYYYSGSAYSSQRQVPHAVVRVVNLYPGFEWVGTTQMQRGHRQLYIVTLRRDNRFIELTINRHGDVVGRNRYVRNFVVRTQPYRRGSGRTLLFHDPGYVYSRNDDRRYNDYNWQQNWKDGKKGQKGHKGHKGHKGQKWTKQDDDRRVNPGRWN